MLFAWRGVRHFADAPQTIVYEYCGSPGGKVRVLVACEFSGVVRDAFNDFGHDAWSCDLLDTERPGKHYVCDVLDVVDKGWDLMVAHPPCTYLSVSGLHWNKKRPERQAQTAAAYEFFMALWNAPIPRIAIENPVGCMSTLWRKPDQIIQPYEFGEDASKSTCLWLKGLPLLKPTGRFPGRWVLHKGKYVERWSNQTDSGHNKLPPSEDRWALRSVTYENIASAMAAQWRTL